MKDKQLLAIVIVVVVLVIFCIALLLSGFFQKSGNDEDEEVSESMTLEELNETLTAELKRMKVRSKVNRLEIDEDQKNVILYEIYMDDKQIAELQGRTIGGWTIVVKPDTEYLAEKEQAWAVFMEMEKDPALQISTFDMSSKEVYLWVYNLTPENEALDGTIILNRTVHIVNSPTPSLKDEY
jgi:hypothetical protein